MEIQFFQEDIDFILDNQDLYLAWIDRLASHHQKILGDINYIFCSDEHILKVNREHLNHDYYTDIITFPLNDDPITSDIFISVDRVKDNASQEDASFDDELKRVMAHGLLHLFGYGDKSDAEAQTMRQEEDRAIAMF